MSVYLVDNINGGHHDIYQSTLKKIDETIILNKIIKFTEVKKNIFKAYNERAKFIKYVNSQVKESDLIHFLYIDSLYKCPFIDFQLRRDRKYMGTLHWIPKDNLRKILLKRFSRRFLVVIVHSEFLKEELLKMGITNVEVIDYPSFIREREDINNRNDNKIIISCLGGTRYDKGLDILIKSFNYLDEDCKKKVVFNICGAEEDIRYDDIINSANINKIKLEYKNKFLTEEEYEDEIYRSDVILLPYRSIFSGNSGPMTDGIYADKFIIGPREGNIGYLIKKYNLGMTFESEDFIDLACKINYIATINLLKNHNFKNKIEVSNFINKYRSVYSLSISKK